MIIKKLIIFLILLLFLFGCRQALPEQNIAVADQVGFIANCYDEQGQDHLVLMDEQGKVIRKISSQNHFPSSAALINGHIYWQNIRTANKGSINDFLYINDPIKDNILSPFHINDLVGLSPAETVIMYKNGIYDTETGKYYTTNDPDHLLCDWLSEDEILGVNSKGIVLSDSKLRSEQVIVSDLNGTYYDVAISPSRDKLAFLRYDASTGQDHLIVHTYPGREQIFLLSRAELSVYAISNPLWLDDQRLVLQGNNPRADIYLVDLSTGSHRNLTATPDDSELYHALNPGSERSLLYYFCNAKQTIQVMDTINNKQVDQIELKADNIMSVNCM